MNAIDYIHPSRRDAAGAAEFAGILAATLSWTPEQFGSEYAWDAAIPAPADMQRDADALAGHLRSLA